MNQEGKAQNYQEYFYGKEADDVKPIDLIRPELLVVPESPVELKLKIKEVNEELKKAQDNNAMFEIQRSQVPEEALILEIKNAGGIVEILKGQQKVLGAKIFEMKPPKSSLRKKLASFLGIFS